MRMMAAPLHEQLAIAAKLSLILLVMHGIHSIVGESGIWAG